MKTAELYVDFTQTIGRIKPMHAVNNVPTVPDNYFGLYEYLRDAAVPYGRLHDTGGCFGGSHFVDIENIFTDPDADENDPDSYDFAFTDVLLQEMLKYGIKPFYRLGCTIENYRYIKAYHIYPPKDFGKWARICEHIIRHYNEGWANGYHMGIEYWEIWNEPDNEDGVENPMWQGTKEQFFDLYCITYRHLKACFPHLKIGGYASCGFYALSAADYSLTANCSPRTAYFVEFYQEFLAHIRREGVGLDFFSWHSYAPAHDNVAYATYVRRTLDEAGFTGCEVFLNEWNPGIHNRGTQKDASDILEMMLRMQNTPTDMLMYYNAWVYVGYCGLFDPVKHIPFPAYYGFLMFGDLYRLQNQCACKVVGENVYAVAASDGEHTLAVLVNTSSEPCEIRLHTDSKMILRRVDQDHRYQDEEPAGDVFCLGAHGIACVRES